jgi:hypothetical protein
MKRFWRRMLSGMGNVAIVLLVVAGVLALALGSVQIMNQYGGWGAVFVGIVAFLGLSYALGT